MSRKRRTQLTLILLFQQFSLFNSTNLALSTSRSVSCSLPFVTYEPKADSVFPLSPVLSPMNAEVPAAAEEEAVDEEIPAAIEA